MGRYIHSTQCDSLSPANKPFFQFYHAFEECEPDKRSRDNSPSRKQSDMAIQSGFMLVAICCETLKMSPEEVLDSDYVLLLSVLKERNFFMNARDKKTEGNDKLKEGEEWITITDFATGQPKKVKRVKAI